MKKVIVFTTLIVSMLTFAFAGSITPVLGMRFNDIANASDALPGPVTSVGLKMEVSDGVYTGFDSNVDGTDFRIFVEQSFGKVGLGSLNGHPTFSVGALYSVYINLNIELEYMMNQLVKTDENGDPTTVNDALRLSLNVTF